MTRITKVEFDDADDIRGYTSSNTYTCPSDGYLAIGNFETINALVEVVICDRYNIPITRLFRRFGSDISQNDSLFCKKGTVLYVQDHSSGTIIQFRKLKN